MRIVGGVHKGKTLQAPKGLETRPTSDRVRESLFNILGHAPWHGKFLLAEARGMDVFAGTGALGLEALSRGVTTVVFIESHQQAFDACLGNIQKLKESDRTTVFKVDATRLQARPAFILPRSLVFLDPPYGKNLGAAALKRLVDKDWLEKGALCVLEMRKQEPEIIPDGFETQDSRSWGDTRVDFLKWTGRELAS